MSFSFINLFSPASRTCASICPSELVGTRVTCCGLPTGFLGGIFFVIFKTKPFEEVEILLNASIEAVSFEVGEKKI